MCITYFRLSNKLGISFSTLLIFILSYMKGKSLWESCNSLGYLTLTSRSYPLSLHLMSFLISLGLTSTYLNFPVGRG